VISWTNVQHKQNISQTFH